MSSKPQTYERKSTVNSENVDIVNASQSIEDAKSARGIEIDTDRVISTDAIDQEDFMRDELLILLSEPANENDPAFVEVNVNGDYRLAVRGNEVKLRRYHVAVLANAKQSRLRQRKIVNPDGSMGFAEENVLSLTYPFQVLHDPRPKQGAPWLRQLLQTPA